MLQGGHECNCELTCDTSAQVCRHQLKCRIACFSQNNQKFQTIPTVSTAHNTS